MTRRFGILKVGAMGDVLMTTPFLRQLRGRFPDAVIDYHVGLPSAAVLEGHPAINRLRAFDPALFYLKKIGPLKRWADDIAAARYDHFFVLDKHLAYAVAARYAAGPRCVGFARSPAHRLFLKKSVPYGALRHAILYYLDLLKFFLEPDYADVRMRLGPAIPSMASDSGGMPMPSPQSYDTWVNSGGMNAREQSSIRRLPEGLFRKMILHHVTRFPVVLLGNRADRDYYERVMAGLPVINLAGQLSILESAAVMKEARSVFTTDCGAMHLASCVRDRLYAFFGPTNPNTLMPMGGDVIPIWHDQDIYDYRYETHGALPRARFFRDEEAIFRDFSAALSS